MTKRLALALFLATLGAMVTVLPALAQRNFLSGHGAAMGARGHVPFRGARRGGYLTGPRERHFNRGYRSDAYPYLYPYYYPDYYSDDYSEQAPAEVQPTRVVVVENSQPRAESPPHPPPESLVLELQGDHWVRITSSGQREGGAQPEKQGSAQTSSLRTITPQQSAALEKARELPPAVLVFRDGHKEKITRYTIVGGIIYTNTDYWNNGSWTRKVPIAELNVPATLEMNQERGARFSLPSGPGEIVVRP
jgi:hypothetical protein